ncbi:ependymin-related protein 1-like isoform X2 [Anneissia japonica]|uniref:ependymin-related protein 1-like isoform X2 n=1 Tax=Anneissia japonica TaxID=1529436 RepID=UPI001425A42E|nr:ependymin-related protein 1-like isoform X2 [Anneissia japonica]
MMRFHSACFVVLCWAVICRGQEKCCIKPDMFAVTSGSLVGWHLGEDFGVMSENIFIVADFTQPRFFYNVTAYVDTNISTTILMDDYKQNVRWVIDPVGKTCQKEPLPNEKYKPINRCVPDNAQFLQQVNNPGNVLVNMWYYEYKTESADGMMSTGVTVDECLPTGGSFVGKTKNTGEDVYIMEAFGFFNFKALTDVSQYFKLPSYCDTKFNFVMMKTKATEDAKRLVRSRRFL